ncbi:CRISPR-associated protein, Csm1 family (plasmid) [Rhodothermus marinus SG0.5JP17-172]|uniref:type III-A CRISPR-associated protein Cas10/Csm1 n=1 Tax=Rhodothermus marinus TaxID=29549 RepID=UPI000223D0F2|nr:CRISPR-associated protein Csm1 [Rhodothermus marinus]AEN74748.1 CRISPR-associated protein, Csm1 family [Rhodothermus marinus SG0.5JP17-172]
MDRSQIEYLGGLLHAIGLLEQLGREQFDAPGISSLQFTEQLLQHCPAFAPHAEAIREAVRQAADALPAEPPPSWLEPLLQRVRLPGHPEPTGGRVFPPRSLSDGVVYPVAPEAVGDGREACRKLWQDLQAEAVRTLQGIEDVGAALETLYTLLEKYTSYIPAPAVQARGVSLFDYSRVTAALRLCRTRAEREPAVLLVKGDVSGIQSFIYRELRGDETENPAQLLRGRSFFVALLARTVVRHLQRLFQLPDGCVLYSSGGHFVMLLPNTEDARQRLDEADRSINQALFRELNGAIQLVLAHAEADARTIEHDPSEALYRLEETLQIAKLRKGWSVLETLVGQPIGETPALPKLNPVGQALPYTDYLIEVPELPASEVPEGTRTELALSGFETTWLFVEEEALEPVLRRLGARSATVFNLRTTKIPAVAVARRTGYRLMPAGVYVPMTEASESRRPLMFEELAAIESANYPLLGFLRMDVDNLGALFVVGLREAFGEHRFGLHRTAALSRELDRFFGAHVNTLARGLDVYLVYAGGDDLFAVGSWVRVLRFARSIREKLREYCGDNPSVTISAGLSIHKEHFPITVAADAAGEEEERAKQAGKNRISLFETPVAWEQLRHLVDELAEPLLQAIIDETLPEEERVPRTFVHTLLRYSREVLDEDGRVDLGALARLNHLLHYTFARRNVREEMLQQAPDRPLVRLVQGFLLLERPDRSEWFRTFVIPAAYVLLKTRKQRD